MHAKDDVMREVRGGRRGAWRLKQEGVLKVGGRREYFKMFTNDKWYGGTIMRLVRRCDTVFPFYPLRCGPMVR